MPKILLIEDMEDIRGLLSERLKAHGYDIIEAKDGQEGLEKAENENPDLIITDLALPKMTGSTVVRVLKKNEKNKHIPIIMLSAFVHEKMGEGVEVPADMYIPKPFEAEELLKKIKELLKR